MQVKAIQIIRAIVSDPARRPAFEAWYSTDHMPKAMRQMRVEVAWRAWSREDPSVHCAFYVGESLENFTQRDPIAAAALRDEFHAAWPDISYSRELLDVVDAFPKAG